MSGLVSAPPWVWEDSRFVNMECPECGGKLHRRGDYAGCACGAVYQSIDGILLRIAAVSWVGDEEE